MAATSSQTLFTEARCFSCLGAVGAAQTMRIALLSQILEGLGTTMTAQELIDYGKCFLCLPGVSLADTVELALLDNISGEISGGGAAGQEVFIDYAPSTPPTDPAKPAVSFPSGGGSLSQWNVGTQTWVAILILMCFAATMFGANPAFTDFNANQFGTANNKVVLKSGVMLTNPVISSGTITGDGSGLTNLVGSGSGFTNLMTDFSQIIENRKYEHPSITVTGTIAQAIAQCTSPSLTNRWRIFIPSGTYNETNDFTDKSGIDLVGATTNRDTVIVTSSSTNLDTLRCGGATMMIANITMLHSNVSGEVSYYPWHWDAATDTNNLAANMLIVNCKLYSGGTGSKSGAGIGGRPGQNVWFVNCDISSQTQVGVNSHNFNGPTTSPFGLHFINCNLNSTGSGINGWGLYYENEGTGQQDTLYINGGSVLGATGGIWYTNDSDGANETVLIISGSPNIQSYAMTNTSRRQITTLGPPLPKSRDVIQEYTGKLATGRLGWEISDDSYLRPLAIGNKLYLNPIGTNYFQADTSGNLIYNGNNQTLFFVDRFGDFTLSELGGLGGLYSRVDNTLDIDSAANRFKTVYAYTFDAKTVVNTASLIPTNGTTMFQRTTIPTNAIPASSALLTNWVLMNLTNTIGGGGPIYVATNYTAAGSFMLAKPTLVPAAWP